MRRLAVVLAIAGLVACTGPVGAQGPTGPQGEQGRIGLTGPTGRPGEPGLPGEQGPRGSRGDQGLQGEKGFRGPQGREGIRGSRGEPGQIGPSGGQGPAGPSPTTEPAAPAAAAPVGDLEEPCRILFDPDTYREIERGRTDSPGGGFRFAHPAAHIVEWLTTFTAPYPDCANRETLTDPGTRVALIRDYHALASSDVSWNAHTKGQLEGWMFLNGVDAVTGIPQRLIEGGTHDPYDSGSGYVSGCAGIDLYPDRIVLTLNRGKLSGVHNRGGTVGEVSERDDWMLVAQPGPRPEGDRYRCNADPEGTL